MLKKGLLGILIIILLFVFFVFIKFELNKVKKFNVQKFDLQDVESIADVELGKRIYEVRAGCIDCHGEKLDGKMVMDNGAIGTIYGSNISPYNLKSWTDEEVVRAIRYGVHKSGRSLNFMPSFDFEELSKGDILSVVKYLRSQPEVASESHQNSFGPIARLMSSLGKMPIMFPAKEMDLKKGFSEKPLEEASVAFGKYLANTCIGCHGKNLMGGPIPGGDPSWPEAGDLRFGSNPEWTQERFTELMKTGISPITKKELRVPMPSWLLIQYNATETEALWLYLSSLNSK